jgi:predicted deacylase
VRIDRLPLTYDECRARFRRSATVAGVPVESHPIAARGPDGQQLAIDVVVIGSTRPDRGLVVLSGVHGVEGFVSSALQCDLIERLDPTTLPDGMSIVVVHAVNPWGMAWGRRQNESNVDLNRNWGRDDGEPQHNDPYDEVHALACPDTDGLPTIEQLFASAAPMVEEHGVDWVRDAITLGQYRHADGLHFGGDRTEESNRVLEAVVDRHLMGVRRAFVLDLHTGHGPRAAITCLSDAPPGSDQDRFLRATFGDDAVEATADNPDATTGMKTAQIGNGIKRRIAPAEAYSTSLEFGTASDDEQLVATYHEQWVHRHGDLAHPDHAAARWAYRCCFTPDDPEWESASLAAGSEALDRAVAAVAGWTA